MWTYQKGWRGLNASQEGVESHPERVAHVQLLQSGNVEDARDSSTSLVKDLA